MFEDVEGARLIYTHILTAGLLMLGLGLSILVFRLGGGAPAFPRGGSRGTGS